MAMCQLDESAKDERARSARLQRSVRRSICSGDSLTTQRDELARLRVEEREHAGKRAAMQAETDACVEKLFELSHALDATDEQHNDDSLLQFMLYSSV